MAILNENVINYTDEEGVVSALTSTYIRLEVLMEPRGHLIVGFYVYTSKESFENRDNPINNDVDFNFSNYNDLTINVVDKTLVDIHGVVIDELVNRGMDEVFLEVVDL
jgi:hypothetical protein